MRIKKSNLLSLTMALTLAIAVSISMAAEKPDPTPPQPGTLGTTTSHVAQPSSQPAAVAGGTWVPHPATNQTELPPSGHKTVVNMKAVSSTQPLAKGGPPKAHVQGEVFQFQPDVGDGTLYRAPSPGELPEPIPVPVDNGVEKSNRAVGDTMVSFDGLANTGWIPPDTIMAVGPDHIVEATNSGFTVYSRFGTQMQAYTTFENFVNLPPGPPTWAGNLFDPRVVFSQYHNKWVMLILGTDVTNSGSFHWLMVSQTSDPTGDWWVSRFGGFSTAEWLDYASLGVDQWGIYVAGNLFNWSDSFQSSVLMSRNPAMMTGGTSNGISFNDLRWPSNDQVFGPKIAHPHTSSALGETFMVNTYSGSGNQICLWKLTGDRAPGGSTPPTLAKSAITLSTSYDWLGEVVDQPDIADDIDGFNCQIMNAVYALGRVYATFATDVFSNGTTGGVISVRLNADTNTKEWEHLFYGGQDYYYFFPAITVLGALSTDPPVGLTFSFAHPINHYASLGTYIYNPSGSNPWIRTADGQASYVSRDSGGRNRWGDYNAAVYDWTCGHLWVAGEYAGTGDTWRTRIAAYDFGGEQVCDRVEVSSPNGGEVIAIGSTETITWQASNPDPSANFYVRYHQGGVLHELSGPLPSTDRSYSWTVGPFPSTEGKVFVGSWDGSGWDSYDYSDELFTVFQPACVPDWTLSCPYDLNSWINNGTGSTDLMDSYSCNSVDYSGPEYAYSFSTSTTSEVTVTLTGMSADLDLLILEGANCYPDTCITAGANAGTADESVTFVAVAGVDYRIVVDGYAGATSVYTVEISCNDDGIFSDGFENGSTTAWDLTVP